VTIVLLVEGDTETALKQHLKRFLDERATAAGHPKVALRTKDMMSPSLGKLRGRIAGHHHPADFRESAV
jgi:hypothetical protein